MVSIWKQFRHSSKTKLHWLRFILVLSVCSRRQMYCIVLLNYWVEENHSVFVLRCVNHKPSISHLASSWQWLVFMDGIIILRLYAWLFGKKISRLIMFHLLWFPTCLKPFWHAAKLQIHKIKVVNPKPFKQHKCCYNVTIARFHKYHHVRVATWKLCFKLSTIDKKG